MLTTHIDAILADFIRRRIPFSHRDVADRIPDLLPDQFDEVLRLVFEQMVNMPAYRLSLARFVGEGLTLICLPLEIAPGPSIQIETPALESGRLVG